MSFEKVKPGHAIAAVAAVVLLASMLIFDWYGGVGGGSADAFDHPGLAGAIADVVLVAACLVAIGGLIVAVVASAPGLAIAASSITAACGVAAVLAVAGRMILQPGPNQYIELKLWIFVGLFAAGGILYGGWIGMRDEAARKANQRHRGAAAAKSS